MEKATTMIRRLVLTGALIFGIICVGLSQGPEHPIIITGKITTPNTNQNLTLAPNGTGNVKIANGALEFSDGTTQTTASVGASWPLTSPSGATVSSTSGSLDLGSASNADITANPNGSGAFAVQQETGSSGHAVFKVLNATGVDIFDVDTSGSGSYGLANFTITANFINKARFNSPNAVVYGYSNGTAEGLGLQGDNELLIKTTRTGLGGTGNIRLEPVSPAQTTTTRNIAESSVTDSFAASLTLDAGIYLHMIPLTGNVTTLSFSNAVAGDCVELIWGQDASGSRTVATPSGSYGFTTPGANANSRSIQRGCYDGTDWTFEVANLNLTLTP